MGILSICQMDTWHIYIYINLYMCLGKILFKGVCKRLQTVPQSRTEDWRLKAWEKLLQSRVLDWRFLGSRSFPQAFKLQSSILDWRIFSQVLNLQYLIRNKTSWYQCSGKGILCMKRVSTFGLFPKPEKSSENAVNYFTTKDDQTCFFISRSNSSRQVQALQTNTFIQKV